MKVYNLPGTILESAQTLTQWCGSEDSPVMHTDRAWLHTNTLY